MPKNDPATETKTAGLSKAFDNRSAAVVITAHAVAAAFAILGIAFVSNQHNQIGQAMLMVAATGIVLSIAVVGIQVLIEALHRATRILQKTHSRAPRR